MAEPALVLRSEEGDDELSPAEFLRSLMRRHLRRCDNDREQAVSGATEEIMANQQYARRIVECAVREGMDQVLGEQYKHQRERALGREVRRVVGEARVQIARTMACLADFPLPSGKALRDCLRSEVDAAAQHYLAQAKTMLERGLWLRMIAQSMPDNMKPVGEVLTDERIEALLDSARARIKKAAI